MTRDEQARIKLKTLDDAPEVLNRPSFPGASTVAGQPHAHLGQSHHYLMGVHHFCWCFWQGVVVVLAGR